MTRVTFNTPSTAVWAEVDAVPRRRETVSIAGAEYVVTAVHCTIADYAQNQSIAIKLTGPIDQRTARRA